MAATRAQKTTKGKKNYGKNTERGKRGENRVREIFTERGYRVKQDSNGRGFADLTVSRGSETRKIQVKNITSRRFLTRKAARNRIAGKPYNVKRIPKDGELWVFDKDGRRYVFGAK